MIHTVLLDSEGVWILFCLRLKGKGARNGNGNFELLPCFCLLPSASCPLPLALCLLPSALCLPSSPNAFV
ncbi:hypothetical protein C7B82_14970 [Stenomitos frigidus ULC18]|uniref:Uncharacterized protein n=1 Tax=Stenomitos frigidus ULC18 TaxID=2107698 RepID=A0A2T1E5W5_9CYAN|nr:hypothetical protein C7B82_14970 [Stenomitos frigidus ULC18]